MAGADRLARGDHHQRGDRPNPDQVRLRHSGLRLSRGPAPARQCDRPAEADRRRRGCDLSGYRRQDLQRRPDQVVEAGRRHVGAEPQSLFQQGVIRSRPRDPARGLIVHGKLRRSPARLYLHLHRLRGLQLLGTFAQQRHQLPADAVHRGTDERHAVRRRRGPADEPHADARLRKHNLPRARRQPIRIWRVHDHPAAHEFLWVHRHQRVGITQPVYLRRSLATAGDDLRGAAVRQGRGRLAVRECRTCQNRVHQRHLVAYRLRECAQPRCGPDASADHRGREGGVPGRHQHRARHGDPVAHHVAEVHRVVGLGTQRAVDGHAALSLHRFGFRQRRAGVSRLHRADHAICRQRGEGRAAHPPAVQLGVRVEPGCTRRDWRAGPRFSHGYSVDYETMTTHTKTYRLCAVLVTTIMAAACGTNPVQVLPTDSLEASRVKFFNFGVNAPGVNFYADDVKMTAILSATGSEATTGVTYGGVGNGGAYSQIAPGAYTMTGRIAAATDKDLPIASINATIADGTRSSLYLSGFYNTTTKSSDGFVVEDAYSPQID